MNHLIRECAECGRHADKVTMREEGGVFVCNHCLVAGPNTQEHFVNMMMTIHQHVCAWHYGAVSAVDAFLYQQAEQANGNYNGMFMTDKEMEAWAARCNAFLALAYTKIGDGNNV